MHPLANNINQKRSTLVLAKFINKKIHAYEKVLRDLAYIDPYCSKKIQKNIAKNYTRLQNRLEFLMKIKETLL